MIDKIKASKIKTTTQLSKLIACAFGDLSVSINTAIMTPGSGHNIVEYAIQFAMTNEAVKLLCSLFEIKNYIAKAASSTAETTITTTTIVPQ